MSDNDMQKQSKAPLIATIIVAVLAVAAVVALIIVLNNKPDEEGPSSEESGFVVTKEFEQECSYAAHDLISQSYEVMRLFVFEGLSYMTEPYGNEPEDGIYTVYTEDNPKYTSLEDIEELVRSVYSDEAAGKILHNIDGNGFEVFKKRKVLVEAEYDSEPESEESRPMYVEAEVLGINAEFKPDASRRDLWTKTSNMIVPISETKCELTIYLGGGVDESTDLSAIDESLVVNLEMVKTANGWRLAEFVC